jgi:hypothetical protein
VKIIPRDLEVLPALQEQDYEMKEKDMPEKDETISIPELKPKIKTKKPVKNPNSVESNETVTEHLTPSKSEPVKLQGENGKPTLDEKSGNQTRAGFNRLVPTIGMIVVGMIAGFLLSYFFLIISLQNQLASITTANSNGNSSSNLMKSDLSTTKLKQQEMETRYQTASDQLESANQYIFLLRMKEQIAVARLSVEQKEGFKARQSLSEIQNQFDHLKPLILKKDVSASEKLEGLIKTSIQHLVSDPESVKSDLAAISDQLNEIESSLFQPE